CCNNLASVVVYSIFDVLRKSLIGIINDCFSAFSLFSRFYFLLTGGFILFCEYISWLNSSSAFCAGLTSVFSTRSLKASSSKTFRSSNIQTVGSSVIGNSTCPFSCIIICLHHFSILHHFCHAFRKWSHLH